jgi:hypothetical protein
MKRSLSTSFKPPPLFSSRSSFSKKKQAWMRLRTRPLVTWERYFSKFSSFFTVWKAPIWLFRSFKEGVGDIKDTGLALSFCGCASWLPGD